MRSRTGCRRRCPTTPFFCTGSQECQTISSRPSESFAAGPNECAEFRVRIRDGGALTYPSWVSGPVEADQFSVHELDDNSWAGCLAAVGGLADEQLDARVWPWRLVVFTPVEGAPGVSGPATVAVVQMSHAFADGVRSSALAARLFGRADEIAPVATPRLRGVKLPWRGLARGACASSAGPRHRSGAGATAGAIASGAANQ